MTTELRFKWKQLFLKNRADGIDFLSCAEKPEQAEIYASYTQEEFLLLDDYNYPRSHYRLWKLVFGQKCYIAN